MPIGLEDRLINNASGFSIAGAIDNDIRGIYWVANTGARDLIGDANINNSDLRAQYVICIVGATPYIYTSASIADVDWTNASNWQEFALGDLTSLTSQVNTNATDIATNAGNISNNTSSISTNAANIATNAGNIATNTSSISTNSGNITTLQGDLAQEILDRQNGDSTLQSQITSNDLDISNLNSSVATNTSNISANATAISVNASNISSNDLDITNLQNAISAIVSADGSINTHSDVDTSTTAPTDGQLLIWNQGSGQWVPGDPPVSGIVLIDVKNDTGNAIGKGVPVYVNGTFGASGKPTIGLADSDGSGTYPAIGLTYQSIANGDEGFFVISSGTLTGLNTLAYAVGDALYLSSSPGVLTKTKPTGSVNKIQKVALVTRVDGSNGSVIVMGAGRTNDVPNLNNGDIFIGDATNAATTQSLNTAVGATSVFTSLLGSVGANTTNIATNAANISSNDTDILNLDGRVTTLEGVGAEANVQSDWTEANSALDSFILNKPTLGTAAAANTTDFAPAVHTHVASNITDFDIEVSNNTDVTANTAKVSADGSVTTHSDVTSAGSGAIITTAERTKLNGIATGATANQTDAHLLDRANHTGTQAAATITGLATVATTGDSTDLIDSADLIRDTNTISDLSFTNLPSTGTVPYLGGLGWTAITPFQQLTFSPTTGSNVVTGPTASTLSLTSSNGSVTITGSTNTLDFTASGGGGSSSQRTLTLPSSNGYSGDVVTFGSTPASGSFTLGALYYYTGSNWELTWGTAQQTSIGLLGICVNTSTPELLVRGIITNSNLGTAFTSGARLYVSSLQGGSGKMMDSVPGTPASGSVLRAAGYVINGLSSQVMFDPSQDFITFP